MQVLTAAPREALTSAQIISVLNADALEVDKGLELLDASDTVVSDLSADLLGGEVERHNYADVHGTVRLSVSRELAWTTDRVRPYLLLRDPVTEISTRYNLGVYLLKTPERVLGESPPVFDVSGVDKVSLLQSVVGDTYVVPTGTSYLDAVTSAISAAGAGSRVNLGGPAVGTTLASPMVWALTESSQATWLNVVNDLLASVGYIGVWADSDGYFRSGPYATPLTRATEWALSVDDPRTSLVSEDRTEKSEGFEAVNSWRFVQRGIIAAPSEGSGVYTFTNSSDGPFSVDTIGRTIRKVVYLDAADQTALVAQGNAVIQADRQVTRTFDLRTGPLPQAGHFDVLTYQDADAGGLTKVQARSWTLPLDGSDMSWILEVI
jgi:hypothetical protein